jgi:hypothetical protein
MTGDDAFLKLGGPPYLISDKLRIATEAGIRAAEQVLGGPLPPSYVSFITRLGVGACDGYLGVFDPDGVATDCAGARDTFTHHAHFWEAGSDVLSQEEVHGLVALGHTIDGDFLAYHPLLPGQFYVLPRHDDHIYAVGPAVEDAWAWMTTSGVLLSQEQEWEFVAGNWQAIPAFHTFEPHQDRAAIQYYLKTPPRRLEAVHEFLIALARSEPGARLIRFLEGTPDGKPSVQQLFLPGDRAKIHCQAYHDGALQVTISYDPTESHPALDRLAAFLEQGNDAVRYGDWR